MCSSDLEQTAQLAINTKRQLLEKSSVCAVWDEDVFTEAIPQKPSIKQLYESNHSMIFNLGCTPEVWMIEKLEQDSPDISRGFRERFRCEVESVIHSEEYLRCNSTKPRKLAKQKMDAVVAFLSVSCGDPNEIVLDALAQIIIDNCYTINDIKRIVAPMLSRA